MYLDILGLHTAYCAIEVDSRMNIYFHTRVIFIFITFRIMWKVPILLFLWSFQQIGAAVDLPPPCDSKIYCTSSDTSLLHTVQMARLYKDSKTFVDKPIKTSEQVVLNHFKTLMNVSICSSGSQRQQSNQHCNK
jgi:hypothetical protein